MAITPARGRRTVELRRFVVGVSLLLFSACLLLGTGTAQTSSPRDALWRIVNEMCIPDQTQNHDPKPCSEVNLQEGVERGFVVLKDLRGDTQYLLLPTARITGIESPAVLMPDVPNYFARAWEERSYVFAALHRTLPPDDISLAVNSRASRSQDALHIHIDCVRTDVYDDLHSGQESIGEQWAPLSHPPFGHPYKAMWIAGEHLSVDPFKLLADGVPGAREDMADYTLVVIGLTRPDGTRGFVLLEDRVNRQAHDLASGEELQDHACRIGRQ